MLIKHVADQTIVQSPTCGEVREILKKAEYSQAGIAIAIDIRSTEGHFHRTFDEIYFVLDGEISLKIYDPVKETTEEFRLKPNELIVITKGLHHKIVQASEQNRLCIVSVPAFHADDELPSEKI